MYTSMFRKAMLGDTATLNLDFTTGTLDSRLTFTRAANTATYINSSGYVTTATANTPRFDYDPVTFTALGLLIESSATNLLNWSETFATTGGTNNNWADTNLTRTSTNNTSPRNDATALRITASAGNGTIISSAAIGTSASRTLSVWLRRVTGTGNIQYTLDNGTNWTTQVITSSWVRYSFAATTAAQRVGFRIVTSGDAIELWGAQLEAGSGATSYISTSASQVTRNADECTATGSNFSSWWPLSQSAFTVYWDGDISRSPANAQFYWLTRAGGSSRSRGYVTTGSLIRANNTAYDFTMSPTTSMTVGTRYRSAVAISSGSSAMYANNSTVTGSDTSAGAVTLFDADSLNFNPNAENFMHIRAFKFYQSRLTNAELLALVS